MTHTLLRLGVRILGEVSQAAAETLRLADHIFIEELRKAGWCEKTSHAFAVFLPVKSVGVTGDGRRHEPVIACDGDHRLHDCAVGASAV